VRRRTSQYLRSLDVGAAQEVELIDTGTHAGLIVVADENRFRDHEEHFQMHAIFEVVVDGARYRGMSQRVFDAVLVHPWGPLTLFGSMVSLLWMHGAVAKASWAAALSNTVKWWDLYCAEGARFANGAQTGDLWLLSGALRGVLRQMGVPVSEIVAPLPAGGLRALLARHPEKFSCVLGAGTCDTEEV
jgi:hypothetical protein